MSSAWRWKIITILVSCVIGLYILTPTFFGWVTEDALSEELKETRPAIASLFPSKGLNLGLDLRGGIYIEFDVVIAEALKDRTDLLHSELERYLKSKKISYTKLVRIPDTYQIKIALPDEAARKKFTNFLLDNYDGILQEDRELRQENTLTLKITDSYINRTKELTMRQAVETIRNRIDKYGVAEPSIQRLGASKIVVELPGIKDPDRAIDLIKRGGKLEFQLVNDELKQDELEALVASVRQEKGVTGFTEEAVVSIQEGLKGKIPEDTEVLFEVHFDPVTKKTTGGTSYLLKKKVELTGDMLTDAQVQVRNNEPYVSLSFNEIGAEIFSEVTGNNIKKRLAIVLDDRVSSAPVIQGKIPLGQAQITLGYGTYQSLLREAEDLALVLREGALPATLEERTKTVVGPSLGKLSIQKGVRAMTIGGILVVLFMLLYYRLSGLFADIALMINVVLIFAILTLFQATLTLPGLAGVILTLGMAVDANVIVFERIREELKSGKNPRAAVESGYSNAMSAIIDANVTTFLAGIILYQFGTGPVRGFAVTLMIGICTTLFTALVITKTFQEFNVFGRRVEKLSI